jgi:hypothetical protein
MRECGCAGDRGRHRKACPTKVGAGSASTVVGPVRTRRARPISVVAFGDEPPVLRTGNIGTVVEQLKRGLSIMGMSHAEARSHFELALKDAQYVEECLGRGPLDFLR